VIVVNKADHPLTDTMVREIKGVFALGPRDGSSTESALASSIPRAPQPRSSEAWQATSAPTSRGMTQ
jgi:hypothetical protein